MIKAIIVDDEIKAIKSLTWELSNFKEDISIVASFNNPGEALEFIKKIVLTAFFLILKCPLWMDFNF